MGWQDGIANCEAFIRERAAALGCAYRMLTPAEATAAETSPLLHDADGLRVTAVGSGQIAVIFCPGGIYGASAVLFRRKPDEVLAPCQSILEASPADFGTYPDLYLAEHPALRGIACLYVRRDGFTPARFRCLALELTEALRPIHICEDAQGASFLWDGLAEEQPLLRDADALLRDFGARAGLSGPFDQTASARGLMTKAVLAAAEAQSAGVVAFSSVRWTLLWRQADQILRDANRSPAEFCHPAVAQMARSDREQGSDHLASLAAYLRSGRRLREAAQQLGVHRNTLDYRIRRLGALFGIDVENAAACFELLFSIHLLERYGDDALPPEPESNAFCASSAQSLLWSSLENRLCPVPAKGACRMMLMHVRGQGEEQMRTAIERARTIFPEGQLAFDDDLICMALPDAPDAEIASRAQSLLQATGLYGILTPRTSLRAIESQLKLLRMFLPSVHTYAPAGQILRIEEHLSDLFFLLLQSHTPLTPYCCDAVIRVMDIDYEKGSSLSGSLYVYLTNFMDMAGAAAQAGLHRNTLEYHLKKIMPLIGGMPGEQLRFEMICTYRMLAAGLDA